MPASSNARANDPRSEAAKDRDLISRGDYTPTPIGKATFFILRSLDPFLQYAILANGLGTGLLHRIGLRTLSPGLPAHTGISVIDGLGLSPYRLIILGMGIGSAVKQNIWVSNSKEPMSVRNAVLISAFNTGWNALNAYAFLLTAISASTESTFPQAQLIAGSTLYVVGILTELISELQRSAFKKDPKNKGKAYTGGLWSFARHINYGAYTIWRTGFAMAAGGWVWGAVAAAFFFSDFATRGVPILNEYCEKRYGAQWEQFKKQTPYKLIPGIY